MPPQGRGLPAGAHTQGGGASSPGAGVRAGAPNGPRGEDREGRDLDVLGPESCPLQAGRARARKPGKGVQEVRPAGSLGVCPVASGYRGSSQTGQAQRGAAGRAGGSGQSDEKDKQPSRSAGWGDSGLAGVCGIMALMTAPDPSAADRTHQPQ